MKKLIELGLLVSGLLAVVKVIGIVSTLLGYHSHTAIFLIKQTIFAAGYASVFVWLRGLQKRNRQKKVDALKAKRAYRREVQAGTWPPPPAV